ncbi:MAG TPA: hypothetical protein VLJ58_22060 [Ramlibacter sp.]|nr:hypothetical protein [Ramlibacter sp.]
MTYKIWVFGELSPSTAVLALSASWIKSFSAPPIRTSRKTPLIGFPGRWKSASPRWKPCGSSSLEQGPMILNKDFKEFAGLLNANGVEYMIVGGYALMVHGHPRYTGCGQPR